jgi:hypothetical protein
LAALVLDGIIIVLTGWAALPLLLVVVTQNAGPFGIAAVLPLASGGLAVPFLLVRLGLAVVGWRSPLASGRVALASSALFALSVAAIPAGRVVVRWQDGRAEQLMAVALDQQAWACARTTAQQHPEEPEPNPGVEIRPRLTAATTRCVEQFATDWHVSCNVTGCQATPPTGRRARVLVLHLEGYLDAALTEVGAGPWNRWPQRGYRLPEPPWVRPSR